MRSEQPRAAPSVTARGWAISTVAIERRDAYVWSVTKRPWVILCAEDDPDDRMLMRDALVEIDFVDGVVFVEDGEEAIAYLRHEGAYAAREHRAPQLVMLDLNMPRKDGREALREIKGDPLLRSIPVVIFTTSNATSDVDSSYDSGASSFITKPHSFSELVGILDQLRHYWRDTVELPSAVG